jgi:hypothetical protein
MFKNKKGFATLIGFALLLVAGIAMADRNTCNQQ